MENFLPYQTRWLLDKSRLKIFEKSRRIGGTWVQSFEDVNDCIENANYKVYFSSSDKTAADEYIDYCEHWASKINQALKKMSEINNELEGLEFIDEDKGIKTTTIEFSNGSKIIALSSSPKAFRSKGGKIVWDEAAWHDNAEKMYAALKPAAMWGFPIRILSTHNGANSVFAKLIEKTKKNELDYSLHTVPITLAVKEGVADRIEKRQLTDKERQEWLSAERKGCLTEDIWQQEYMCSPADESKAFLTYDIIRACERDNILTTLPKLSGNLYLGVDVARKRHLTVFWVIEQAAGAFITRYIKSMRDTKWAKQEEELYRLLDNKSITRACLDSTGLGNQFCERAQDKYGKLRVEAVNFTNAVKENLAINLFRSFEDEKMIVPKDDEMVESLHSIRKITTAAGNTRYDAAQTESGHGDYFWANALAQEAAKAGVVDNWIMSEDPFEDIRR